MLKKIREKKWFIILSNRYVLTGFFFVVWMLFLDANSYLIHHELNEEIDRMEEGIDYYSGELEVNKEQLEALESDPEKLEKFAREEYWMHQPGEEIYLIEFEED